jgi:NADH:ubiquinone oxidoreductase subunit 5 (subunit L)/multisubunit Na+/H+ antiporter MnhA subunit
MAPFLGSMFSVLLVFIVNSALFAEKMSTFYANNGFRAVYRFLSHKWYFDTVYNRMINQPLLECGYRVVFALLDKGLLEAIGPTGLGKLSFQAGTFVTAVQSGRAYDYA